MEMSKVIKPLIIPAAALLGYALIKGKRSSSLVSDITQAVSNSATNLEKTFAGLKESELNEIATNTDRGLKAEIVGNALEYCFKSASGKKTATARIELDSAGKPEFAFLPYSGSANSPYSFIKNLRDALNKDN
ncbi:hypothetical protein [Rossellomorea sp. LjRoot5]|uniref:hypothetical protein n=1 Tax=Rossellomorea sp. LjRoot5 TaxID=3342331 RepID=UPI003ECD7178